LDGIASVTGLPTTDSVGHVIATSGGVDAIFEIAPDEETSIVSLTYEPEATDDAVDDTSDSETVDEMPDTGTGPLAPQGNGSELLISLASVIAIAGLSALIRRRAA
jgi:hypothetical protein